MDPVRTRTAMAGLGADDVGSAGTARREGSVTTARVATALGRKPQSLSPARDALIKKGLGYSSERGTVAFTVPHFGRLLRARRG